MELVQCLMETGFTRHEAILYITLCRLGEMTGYEAAKTAGIPRSNAYLALAGLVEKGGVYRVDSESAKYMSVPVDELVVNVRKKMEESLSFIENNIPHKQEVSEPYITITGERNVLNKMKNMLRKSKERIYISMQQKELLLLEDELTEAVKRGLKVVIITSKEFELPGAKIYHKEKKSGKIRLITDTTNVLTGELGDDSNSVCLYSRNRTLIDLIKDSLTNEIKLIELNQYK